LQNFENAIQQFEIELESPKEEQEPSISRQTNPGPDYKPNPKEPIRFVYCGLCSSELQKRKPVECEFNPGLFKLRYHCFLCQLDYWGLSIDRLVLVKDNETKPIIETIEY